MSYYMGDYYRGDYYRGRRGDPFSLGGILKGVGGVLSNVPGVGLIGTGLKTIGGLLPGGSSPVPTIVPSVVPPTSIVANQASMFGSLFGGTGAQPGPGSVPVKGLGGAISRLLPGGDTGYRKRRRMNVTNPKALRRSIRRISGFGKLVGRVKKAVGRANTAVGNRHRGAARKRGR